MSWHIHEVYSWLCWYIWMSHYWWVVDTWFVYTWYIVGCTCLLYRLITGCLAQVGAWLMLLFMVQIDICWGLLSHLSWCWECKLCLAYRSGALVELYYIQLLLKNPWIEVHNKKKNCTYILCSLCSLWWWHIDDICCWYMLLLYVRI